MCSLFKNSDLVKQQLQNIAQSGKIPAALNFETESKFLPDGELSVIQNTIGELKPGGSVWFQTDGAWSSYHLLEFILDKTGPAAVSFTTWSISEIAITRFLHWKESGRITELQAVIDNGLRNRKPAIYQQAVKAFPNLKVAHCHAKATVVRSQTHDITFIGSANYTKNPRKEVGVIIWDSAIAQANEQWIKEVVNGH